MKAPGSHMIGLQTGRYAAGRGGRHRGFTLVEVMVALLVLTIGLLGLQALQALGLRSGHTAYLNSQAALLAYDVADRIRANPDNAAQYAVTCTDGAPDAVGANPLAAADVAEWCAALALAMPDGAGTVAANADEYTVTVTWVDNQAPEGAAPWQYQMAILL